MRERGTETERMKIEAGQGKMHHFQKMKERSRSKMSQEGGK